MPLSETVFRGQPPHRPRFLQLNGSSEDQSSGYRTKTVRIIFGEADPYLDARVAHHFHGLFPDSELFVLPTARHSPQQDEPEEVARLILSTPLAMSRTDGVLRLRGR